MKCFQHDTRCAFVDDISISIKEYSSVMGIPYCKNGHQLCGVKGENKEWYFRHKNTSDINGELSEWHKEWQRHFDDTEVTFYKIYDQNKVRRADIVEGSYVIEIQHSSIKKEEVENRNKDYSLHGKKVLWVIDGTELIVNGDVLTFNSNWKYSSFITCEYIYINIGNYVYKVIPQAIKSLTIHVNEIEKNDFIESIKNDTLDKWTVPCQSKLYLKQQGAGNGKTWGIIQMLGRNDFKHYKVFIYVTKQHSAKTIIKEEFISQQSTFGFTEISIKDLNKKYLISYKNSIGQDCCIIISTIDSFMYSVGNKNVSGYNKFQEIARSIVDGHLEADLHGKIKYATNPKLNAETLYIIDEAQDLHSCYAEAVIKVMKETNIDVYVVGDKLQSISNEINAFSVFKDALFAITETPVNICRRFTDPKLIHFVNDIVPFEKYNLPCVVPYKDSEPTESIFHHLISNSKNYINDTVDKFIFEYNKQVEKYGYMPENFLVIVPFVSDNPLACMLDVAINDYWSSKIPKDEYFRYCIIHRSEEGSSINLDDSSHSTRIVSIHTSKGDGREVVFVLGLDDYYLKCCSGIKNSLIYDSLIHVALTRMKKTLYIFYKDNDEFGNKIKNWVIKNNGTVEIDKLEIKQSIRVIDIINIKGEELTKLDDIKYVDTNDKTELIDMSHHNIRFGIIKMKIVERLRDEIYNGKKQMYTQSDIALQSPVVVCNNWKEYNKCVYLNRPYDDNDITHSIPLLDINSTYKLYTIKIKKIIERIKYNSNQNISLCPLELIVFYYMIQITQKGHGTQNGHDGTEITIIELYNIFYYYEGAYQHHMRSHDKCLCKTQFKDNDNDNSLKKYLVTHYEQMEKIDLLIDFILSEYPNTSWNIDHPISIDDNTFCIKSSSFFIGYNENDVIVLYVKPVLNSLNFNEIKTKSILDRFIIQNLDIDSENYKRYSNKKIKMYIIATNLTEPYLIMNETTSSPIEIIRDAIYEKYKIINKEFYYFYLSNRKNMECKSFFVNWENIKEKIKNSFVPKYINDFIISIKDRIECDDEEYKEINFEKDIDKRLKKSTERFLG